MRLSNIQSSKLYIGILLTLSFVFVLGLVGQAQAGVLKDFSLALLAVAEVGTFGANKYTRGGWQSVPNGIERYEDAFWRHLLQERHDPTDTDGL